MLLAAGVGAAARDVGVRAAGRGAGAVAVAGGVSAGRDPSVGGDEAQPAEVEEECRGSERSQWRMAGLPLGAGRRAGRWSVVPSAAGLATGAHYSVRTLAAS